MNHRDEDRSPARNGRGRERGRLGARGGSGVEPGSYRSSREDWEWGGEGSGGSSYGASGYGEYRGEGQPGREERGSREPPWEEGRFSEGEAWGGARDEGRRYAQQGGSSNWRPQREGGSYGGYGSTGDYGYGSQGRSHLGRGGGWEAQESRRDFGGEGFGTSGGGSYGDYFRGSGPTGSGQSAYGQGGRQGSGVRQLELEDWSGSRSLGGEEQRFRGSKYLGKGPKGYKRSDERLREDISERLMQSGWIDSSEVTVEVADGTVTLQGTVPERRMKHEIEDLIDGCLGEKDIDNRVRVQRADSGASSGMGSGTSSGPGSGMSGGSTEGGSSTTQSTSLSGGSSTAGKGRKE
jgi:osmotically-inducible protein OsmY